MEEDSGGKRIAAAIAIKIGIFLLPFFLMILIPVLIIACLFTIFGTDPDQEFDPRTTVIYGEVSQIYNEYEADLRSELEQMAQQRKAEKEEEAKAAGTELRVRTNVSVSEIGYSILFAYITTVNYDGDEDEWLDLRDGDTGAETDQAETDQAAPDQNGAGDGESPNYGAVSEADQMELLTIPAADLIKGFLAQCTKKHIYEGQSLVTAANINKKAEDVAEEVFKEDSQKDLFLTAYDEYLELFQETAATGYGNITVGGLLGEGDGKIPSGGLPIPLYLQGSPTWGSYPYGDGTLSSNACGPTCMAMLASYYNQTTITPLDVTTWAGRRYWSDSSGTSWAFMTEAPENYGFHGANIGNDINAVVTALKDGQAVVASVSGRAGLNNYFANAGHYIVLRGMTEDGLILVNDPGGNGEKNAQMAFEPSFIAACAKQYWRFWSDHPVITETAIGTVEERETYIWNYLTRELGVPAAGAAGILGNIKVETDQIDPTCVQGHERDSQYCSNYAAGLDSGAVSRDAFTSRAGDGWIGYGIFQLGDGERHGLYYDFCKLRGYSLGDIRGQLEYMYFECTTGAGGKRNMEAWTVIMDPDSGVRECAEVWAKKYERCYAALHGWPVENRVQEAEAYYDRFGGS